MNLGMLGSKTDGKIRKKGNRNKVKDGVVEMAKVTWA